MNNKLETIALVFLGLCIGCFIVVLATPRQYVGIIVGFSIAGVTSLILMLVVFAMNDTPKKKTCMACKKPHTNTNSTLCHSCDSIYEAEGPAYLESLYN